MYYHSVSCFKGLLTTNILWLETVAIKVKPAKYTDIRLNVCVLSPDMGILAALWSILVMMLATFSSFSRSPEDSMCCGVVMSGTKVTSERVRCMLCWIHLLRPRLRFIPRRVLRRRGIAEKLRLQLNLTCKLCIADNYTLRVQKLTESAR